MQNVSQNDYHHGYTKLDSTFAHHYSCTEPIPCGHFNVINLGAELSSSFRMYPRTEYRIKIKLKTNFGHKAYYCQPARIMFAHTSRSIKANPTADNRSGAYSRAIFEKEQLEN